MDFRDDSVAQQQPTHKLVAKNPSGVKDWDEEGTIGIENQAMEIIVKYGSTVHVEVDPAHSQFEAIQNELTRLPEAERIFIGSEEEYRAELPTDHSFITSLLEIRANSTDEWIDRLFNIEAFAVLTDQSWVYRSVPHHSHIREINATRVGGLVPELHRALEQRQGGTVVPFDD